MTTRKPKPLDVASVMIKTDDIDRVYLTARFFAVTERGDLLVFAEDNRFVAAFAASGWNHAELVYSGEMLNS